jgi:hypothetical protein
VARTQKFRRKRREETPWSNPQGLLLAALPFVVMAALLVVFLMRHERFLSERGKLPFAVIPWDASWPELPVANIAGALRDEVARALYAFAGRRDDVLRHIPCYCGCRMQGHGSNHDCFVSKRAADGRVTEWNRHAMTCPLAGDITGDVTLWTEQGRALLQIRNDIDREYSSRGPGTLTPLPSH